MRLTVVLSLLVPTAASTCFEDAVPASDRRNLVNVDGETYPVGFFIGNWAAGYAANVMAAILTEEILGYNVHMNFDAPGPGQVDAYFGLTGCRTYNDVSDRGCDQGATRYHIQMEGWMGVNTQDWNFIQTTYPTMGPKDLGSMGYDGFSTTFLPKPAQQNAYSTAGLALQFYRNWNASWNAPSTYFASLSSIDSTKLMPCTKSIMSDDLVMRRHVKFTGDADGVVITNDKYAGKCFDSWWWAPPSCRDDTSRCVPHITGGTGWQSEAMMQKTTLFNMPIASAVAASYGDYTTLPQAGNMIFYWWTPDPTFLELSPMVVKFPEFKSQEFQQGVLTSESAAAVVSALSSRDLEILAPVVERFVDGVDLPVSEMDTMLLDHKNRGLDYSEASWRNVTCTWLRNNRAMWQTWIPDESVCYPGFGLYDAVLDQFTDDRNVTNKIVCQACEPGTHSEKITDRKGDTQICVPCEVGTSQASGASLSCKACKAGEYQDAPGQKECMRCATGTYQDENGQIGCKTCPADTSTLGVGSVAASDCGCQKDYIDIDRTGAYNCVKCSEGMKCPALSSLVDLERGESDVGEEFTPQILAGYYTARSAPTEVFRCGSSAACPGGQPGSCSGGLVETPCSACAEGSTWTGSTCEDCAGWRQAIWGLAVCGIFATLTLLYYLTTSKVTAKATVLFATTASFGMLLMSMQNMGLVGMMTVDWPVTLDGIFSICKFFLLDIDSYGFSCIAGQSEPIRYLLSALIFPVGLGWLFMCWGVSKLFPPRYRWSGSKVVSCMGAFLQVGFSTMSATSLAPMMCYKHPNGLRSILKYPGILCGSADHDLMLVIGWILLTVFVLGFVALCTFAVKMVPKWSAERQDHLVAAVRFLVFRFRLDSWWFGVPLLVRGPLINLPVVLATDFPPIQVVCISMILTTMMVLQMLAWPWKVPMLNLTDCIVSFCIVLLVTTSTLHLNVIDETMYAFASGITTAMLSGIGISVGIMVFMTVAALFHRAAMGGKQELKFFNLGSVPSAEGLAKKVKALVEELEAIEFEQLKDQLSGLSVFDMNKVTTCITLMATEVAPPAEEGHTYKFNKRIASASFDAALKRKPQSRRDAPMREALAQKEATAEENNKLEVVEDEDPTKTAWI